MMQHSTDYNATVSQLGMGDRFQLSQHGAVETVAWTDGSVDGSVVYVRTGSGDVSVIQTYRRCHVTQYAPRCGCGRRFERCEQGCDWPDELEALFMAS
jgi:hypothetical protein